MNKEKRKKAAGIIPDDAKRVLGPDRYIQLIVDIETLIAEAERRAVEKFVNEIDDIKLHTFCKNDMEEVEYMRAWQKVKPIIKQKLSELGMEGKA